ncbi:hypothetical protein Gal_01620 [Phaeobacter gallaeciensis DSM 26640]|nr:hypothetical protein Gal_01620 [Phaeobacter gallaeciensis DSM 26640]ATE92642.1 hypothetical protein PhaeoP11_01611 [Phaeobacter gallaeciensis]
MNQPIGSINDNMCIQNDESRIRINVSVERFDQSSLVFDNVASAKVVLGRQLFLLLHE